MKLLFGNSGLLELVKLLLEDLLVSNEDPGCAGYADNKILVKLKDFDADFEDFSCLKELREPQY